MALKSDLQAMSHQEKEFLESLDEKDVLKIIVLQKNSITKINICLESAKERS